MEESVRFGERGLAGVLHSPPRRPLACVITCHGFLSNKDSPKYIEMANRFCEEGFSVLRFDFRGCGESPGELDQTTLSGRIEDLGSALDFVVGERKHEKVGLMGSSLGGCVSILKAGDERVKALVTWATPCIRGESFGLEMGVFRELQRNLAGYDITKTLRETNRPILIIHGSSDKLVPPSQARALYENANQPKNILMVEGADHVFSDPVHRRKAIEATLDWLKKYLQKYFCRDAPDEVDFSSSP